MKLLKRVLSKRKLIYAILFYLYIAFILWVTLLGRTNYPQRIFRPKLFWAFRDLITGNENGLVESIQYINNILFFVPFGYFCPWNKSAKKVFIMAMLTSIFIEISQYIFLLGECEVDDIISNTMGALLGRYVFKIMNRCLESRREQCLKGKY